jgi:hypothetical protein
MHEEKKMMKRKAQRISLEQSGRQNRQNENV